MAELPNGSDRAAYVAQHLTDALADALADAETSRQEHRVQLASVLGVLGGTHNWQELLTAVRERAAVPTSCVCGHSESLAALRAQHRQLAEAMGVDDNHAWADLVAAVREMSAGMLALGPVLGHLASSMAKVAQQAKDAREVYEALPISAEARSEAYDRADDAYVREHGAW